MDCNKAVTKSGTPIKLLLGGSPCTKWSIAQKKRTRSSAGRYRMGAVRELSDSEREIPARHLFI